MVQYIIVNISKKEYVRSHETKLIDLCRGSTIKKVALLLCYTWKKDKIAIVGSHCDGPSYMDNLYATAINNFNLLELNDDLNISSNIYFRKSMEYFNVIINHSKKQYIKIGENNFNDISVDISLTALVCLLLYETDDIGSWCCSDIMLCKSEDIPNYLNVSKDVFNLVYTLFPDFEF